MKEVFFDNNNGYLIANKLNRLNFKYLVKSAREKDRRYSFNKKN